MSTLAAPSNAIAKLYRATHCNHHIPVAPHHNTPMASAAKKKLVVCGGNGFLGK
jgi:hypothetical protein